MVRLRELLRELHESVPIPRPRHLETYVAAVAAHRGRPITLTALSTAALTGGCGAGTGLWIRRRDDDIIVYDQDAVALHAQHIVLHEIGHMLLGHDRRPRPADPHTGATLAALLPSISAQSIEDVLSRNAYDDEIERHAEAFADATALAAGSPAPSRASMRHSLLGGRRP